MALEIARNLANKHWLNKEVFAAREYINFHASNGWFEKFKQRFRLSHRNRTSLEAPLVLNKPFETHLKKYLLRFYDELDSEL